MEYKISFLLFPSPDMQFRRCFSAPVSLNFNTLSFDSWETLHTVLQFQIFESTLTEQPIFSPTAVITKKPRQGSNAIDVSY